MAKNYEQEIPSINLIASGTIFKGDITSNGDFRIDGTLIGSITSKSKVVIGTTGVVDGEIHCQNADFSGKIKADVKVGELLTLKSTSNLIGNLTIGKLAIEPGAQFTGNCSMENEKYTPTDETLDDE
ncbi:MAG: polymer-forming cytoskeletal protein [Bacteroidales bacterium]|nr:polymer-forming cytoskeletal protein [Bacteroidales bacterium]MDY0216870.1 polymer-forming cytoskeletal protein [Bacteroidales bacterium]